MSAFRSILASFVALALLASVAPTAQAAAVEPPVCQHVVTGPDVQFGVCADPSAECGVWTYSYGGDTCYAPGAGVVPRAHCERLLYGPDIDQGLCYDLDGETVAGTECIVWWYSAYSTGTTTCYVPAPPLAASGSLAALPRAHCEQLLVGPDIDQGLCYDLDGEQVAGQECMVWWYSTYSTGTTTCYVAAPPGVTGEHCERLFYGPDIDQGVCWDLSRDTCQAWYYSKYGTGPNFCIT